MELYTLTDQFLTDTPVDEYISALWTERYTDSGELVLSVEDTPDNRVLLAEDTFVATPASDEVMMLHTQDVEKGVLKVTGNTLDSIFKSRILVPSDILDQAALEPGTGTPAHMMGGLVWIYATTDGWTTVFGATTEILQTKGWRQAIPNLILGAEAAGTAVTLNVERGALYDAVKKLGQTYNVGWKLVPTNLIPGGMRNLEFSTYVGLDRTSAQSVRDVVRFSPQLDSLADVKELRSKVNYRTVAYAITPDFDPMTLTAFPPHPYTGKAYAYPTADSETGFARRVLLVEITGMTAEAVGDSIYTYEDVMDEHARNALANNNFTKVVDGEVVPQNQFKFGTDYLLGDLVELQDKTGYLQTARITEYIRSSDKNGYREYPTVSVIE